MATIEIQGGDFGVAQGWSWGQNCLGEAAPVTMGTEMERAIRASSVLCQPPHLPHWWEQSKVSFPVRCLSGESCQGTTTQFSHLDNGS